MESAARPLGAVDPAPNTLSEATFRRLRADILLGRFQPGQRLLLAELRLAYGVSGTVIREALYRLTAGGFVITEGQRGFRVAEVSEQDLLDLTKTRIWIEGIALRSAIAFGDRNWEAEILAAAHRLGPVQPWRNRENPADLDEKWVASHRGYHQALVSACRSPQLLSYRALLHDLSDRYKRLSGMKGDRDLAAEHRALTEAVLDRDADRACACIEEHFLATTATSLVEVGNSTCGVAQLLEQLRAEIRAGMPDGVLATGE
jgi:GntR family carbon starvation induced transcriptional regulator